MRPLQDTVHTRYGASMEYPELPDSFYDRLPVYLVPKFTQRKKVNRKFRKNKSKAAFVAAPFGVYDAEFVDDLTAAFGENAFAGFFGDAEYVIEEPAIGEEQAADLAAEILDDMVDDDAQK